jgi:hypothetical protein
MRVLAVKSLPAVVFRDGSEADGMHQDRLLESVKTKAGELGWCVLITTEDQRGDGKLGGSCYAALDMTMPERAS